MNHPSGELSRLANIILGRVLHVFRPKPEKNYEFVLFPREDADQLILPLVELAAFHGFRPKHVRTDEDIRACYFMRDSERTCWIKASSELPGRLELHVLGTDFFAGHWIFRLSPAAELEVTFDSMKMPPGIYGDKFLRTLLTRTFIVWADEPSI